MTAWWLDHLKLREVEVANGSQCLSGRAHTPQRQGIEPSLALPLDSSEFRYSTAPALNTTATILGLAEQHAFGLALGAGRRRVVAWFRVALSHDGLDQDLFTPQLIRGSN
jgi:hypothetical protein